MGIEIACCLQMKDSQVVHYLTPLALHPDVSRLHILRTHASTHGAIPKSDYITVPRPRPARWLRMLKEGSRLAQSDAVRAFVSFNPFPYGLIACAAARRAGVPVHLGFMGTDWYRHMKSPLRVLLRPAVRRADFITATGEGMRSDMIGSGLDPKRIAVLPHAIDLEQFPIADPDQVDYTCVFVGRLTAVKRVDLILHAFAALGSRHAETRLCIVGDGPLKAQLEALADQLRIRDRVDFTGFSNRVQDFLSRSLINIIASDYEGFPFALVEGTACGLVPVCTPVGTIPDFVQDGENGLLFPAGDAPALATCIERLLDDRTLYLRLRERLLEMREAFSYDRATAIWDPWVRTLS